MPRGMFKSRTLRRTFTRLPSGKTQRRFKQRNHNPAVCGRCGAELKGIPRGTPKDTAKLSKTQKRPERPYGGVLCSRCLKDILKLEARDE